MGMQLQTEAKATSVSTPTLSFTPVCTRLLQRTCACGGAPGIDGECTECHGKRLSLQRRATNSAELSTVSPIVQDVLHSPSQPLDSATRTFMEPRFGYDFSSVRVHTDARAAESAQAVNALAYTVGSHVVFGSGQYAPGTNEGKKTLAHELAHTIQQGSELQCIPDKLETTKPNDTAEKEAQAAAHSVIEGETFAPTLKEGLSIARQPKPPASAPTSASAAAAAPAKKTVTVNVTYLKGGSTDLSTHLAKAKDVYKQANVEVKAGKEETLDEAKSKAILGADLILDEYSNPSTPTTEEKELLKVNRKTGTITMYYVKGMSHGSLGEAFWASTGQPVGFVYASTTSRTWPHELGHVLLDDGSHPADADNFMAQTAVATGKELMTADQIKKIRSSSFVK